jgi:hypothetical protein
MLGTVSLFTKPSPEIPQLMEAKRPRLSGKRFVKRFASPFGFSCRDVRTNTKRHLLQLALPYLTLGIKYFDLGLESRDVVHPCYSTRSHQTNDKVTIDPAEAILKCNIEIKYATITPDEARVKELNLKQTWKNPN